MEVQGIVHKLHFLKQIPMKVPTGVKNNHERLCKYMSQLD